MTSGMCMAQSNEEKMRILGGLIEPVMGAPMVQILNRHSQLNIRPIGKRLARSREIGQQQRQTGGREETLSFL
jgi:hypothetical protein